MSAVVAAALAFVHILLANSGSSAAGPFSHLETRGGTIATRHGIPLTVAAPDFRITPASHRRAMFGGHPFEVSLAALLADHGAVMVHAERVSDSSGRSNYDDLPRADWPSSRFGKRSLCATVDESTIAEEHDLAFLRRHGWDPVGSLVLDQYLATTPDHNQEVVISLVVRVPACDQADAAEPRLRRLREEVQVSLS